MGNTNSRSPWETRSLLSLADYHNGAAFNPSDWGEEGIPIVRIEQINNPAAPTDFYAGHLHPSNRINNGDLVFSWSATLKAVIWQNGEGALNQHLFKVVPRSGTDQVFLKYILEENMDRISAGSQGSTMKHITRGELRRFCVSIPSDEKQQKRIAEILGTVDKVIGQTEALIAKQQQVKAGLMHDLFTRGLTPDGQLRPTRAEAPELYRESPLGWLPKEWVPTTVGECLLGIDAGKSPECPDTPAVGEQWGVLKVGAVHPDGLREHENKVVVSPALRVASYLVAKGDLLFSRANTLELVGLSSHVRSRPRNLMLSDKTLRLRVHSSRMTVRFLFWVLQAPTSRRQIENSATGTSGSMKNISQGGVRGIRCARPDLDEQLLITNRLDAAIDTLTAEKAHLAKLRQLKLGLMQALLTPPG